MRIWLSPVLSAAVAVVCVHPQDIPQHHTPTTRLRQQQRVQTSLGRQQPDLLGAWRQQQAEDLDNRRGRGQGGEELRSGRSNHDDGRARKAKEEKEAGAAQQQQQQVGAVSAAQGEDEGDQEIMEKEQEGNDIIGRLVLENEYTGWSPELSAGRDGPDGSGARRVVSGVAAPTGGILGNVLSVFAEIKGDILVRAWGRMLWPLFN